jgi:uncharacterized damage-inducible protein DinB
MEIQDTGAFLEYIDKVHQRTMRVVRCIPPEGLDWTYRGGKFTLRDLVRHIATIERYMFAETAAGRPSRYAGRGKDLADGHEQVLEFAERLHRESVEIIAQLDSDGLNRKCTTPDGASITTWKWLRAMVEHEIHHRGPELPLPKYVRGADASALWIDLRAGAGAQYSAIATGQHLRSS